MLKLEFDANNKALAAALGAALQAYGQNLEAVTPEPALPEPDFDAPPQPQPEQITSETAPEATVTLDDSNTVVTEDSTRTDVNGVPYNPDMCASLRSANPFMKDGSWKKGRGTDKAQFDSWYASARVDLTGDEPEPVEADTAAAFNPEPEPEAEKPIFKDAGEFMQWVAERQASGRLSNADLQAAYAETGVDMQSLFNPALAADNIAKVYDWLEDNIEGIA